MESILQKGRQTGMLPLWSHMTPQEGVPKFGIAERGETTHFLPLCRQYLSHLFLQTLLSPYYADPCFSLVVRPWRYLLHFPPRGIEHHHGVHPPEGGTNRDATTVESWDTSRESAQV
jgi:hypothetical protein